MKFSNHTKIALFILLIILNLLLRLFVSNHELMIDSFEMHILANSISEFGDARWWTNPSAVVGMYPNSYASMIPFFLSGISQISGFDIEYSVFIYSIIFGIFTIFASYMLAGILYDDDLYKFLVSFGFSLSPGVLAYTTWVGHARSPFIILLPLFIYTILKLDANAIKIKFMCLIFTILLFTTHHMAFYLFPILIAYLIVEMLYFINKHIKVIKIDRFTPWYLAFAFLLVFSLSTLSNKFQTASSRWDNLSLMINEYPRYIGILIFLSIGGLVYLMFKPNKRKEEWIFLSSLVLITPFLGQEMYTKWFIQIFAFLLAGIGLMNLKNAGHLNKKYTYTLLAFLVISVSFSGYFQYFHQNAAEEINHNEYISSIWIKQFSDDNFISNNRLEGWKIAAISGKHFLTGSATGDQAYGFLDVKEFGLINNPINSIEYWLDSPYKKINGTTSDGYWQIIMEHDINSNWNKLVKDRFNITAVLEFTINQDRLVSRHGIKPSPFIRSVSKEKDLIYDSGDFNVWALT